VSAFKISAPPSRIILQFYVKIRDTDGPCPERGTHVACYTNSCYLNCSHCTYSRMAQSRRFACTLNNIRISELST